jgi:hypothetical protein
MNEPAPRSTRRMRNIELRALSDEFPGKPVPQFRVRDQLRPAGHVERVLVVLHGNECSANRPSRRRSC